MSTTRTGGRWRRTTRAACLGIVLAFAAMVVPDGSVASTRMALVKMDRADGVDVNSDVVWILAVGSDARRGQPVLRSRGDALQLVGLNTKTGAATSIGIPRDSWVPIPGHGSSRVNAAMVFGGPQLLGQTVGNLVGVQPDYVFVTSFWGLSDSVNEIGGITVDNPRAFSDSILQPGGFAQGKVRLDGPSAVNFGRIRKSLPAGDFDRSANQRRVLAGIQAAIAKKADQPGFIESGVLSVMKHIDANVPPAELFKLGQVVAQVDPKKITGCVLPGGSGNIGGASVVLPDTATAKRWGDQARKTAVIKSC